MEHTQQMSPHMAIFPSPEMGHLIPLVELAKRLVLHHGFSVTFIITTDGSPMKPQIAILESLPDAISSIFLPPDVKIETRIRLSLTRSLPALQDSFKVLAESTRLVALVVDVFGTDAFDVAKNSIFYIPELDQNFSCEYRDLPERLKLPRCVRIHGSDFSNPKQYRKNAAYERIKFSTKRYSLAARIKVNNFIDLEPGAFEALKKGGDGKPPPSESVLYVSFDRGGTFSHEQLNELALGLEMSGQRLHEKVANATYFSVQSINDPFYFLPKGFLERTKQVVLSHGLIGGFLTHCGWNSIPKSIMHGVPLIAWPLYAEQRLNAILLADDFTKKELAYCGGVKMNDNGLVGHKDIANYSRSLIEGEEGKLLWNKMKDLKDTTEKALSKDGSFTKSLVEVAQIWETQKMMSLLEHDKDQYGVLSCALS
ncbi:hypothetical protein ACB094_01G142200 [Castanea mollissima]